MRVIPPFEKPLFYAAIYITPSPRHSSLKFKKQASTMVEMTATELGYTGLKTEHAADGRVVIVCYWDSYRSLSRWKEKAERYLLHDTIGLNNFLCTTGCLWPWLFENYKLDKVLQDAA